MKKPNVESMGCIGCLIALIWFPFGVIFELCKKFK